MISLLLIFSTSLWFIGVVNRVKSITASRKGPGWWQHLFDIQRLWHKELLLSPTTTWIFQWAPSIQMASLIAAASVIPIGNFPALFSFEGDFIFFVYILAASKFISILSAMDTGSAFEGMGASREAFYSMLVEPAFFVLMGSLALLNEATSFTTIFVSFSLNSQESLLISLLAAWVLMQIAMIENSRMPVDDPKTHLELTMIHEVMILDQSGPDLALLLWGQYFKFAIYGALIANLFVDPDFLFWVNLSIFLFIQVFFAMLVGLIESFRARNRMYLNPQFIFSLTGISIMIFFAVLIIKNKLIH